MHKIHWIGMHKIHWIGMSGVVYTKCGEVYSRKEYIRATEDDSKVTCKKCQKEVTLGKNNINFNELNLNKGDS